MNVNIVHAIESFVRFEVEACEHTMLLSIFGDYVQTAVCVKKCLVRPVTTGGFESPLTLE